MPKSPKYLNCLHQCSGLIYQTKDEIASPMARNDNTRGPIWNLSFRISLIIMFSIISTCTKFQKRQTIIEPINIAVVDESRIDNMKIRHIFHEFLLKEIINKGNGWLNVFDSDTISNQNIDYLIDFDIMDYSSADIEKGTEKLLVSTKIVKVANKNIINSYVESVVAKNIDQVCQKAVERLSLALTGRLLALHKFQVPETSSMPADTSK